MAAALPSLVIPLSGSEPRRATGAPSITLLATCAPVGVSFEVSVIGYGWTPKDDVTVSFHGAESTKVEPGEFGLLTATFTVSGRPPGTYVVEAEGVLRDADTGSVDYAWEPFPVPCPGPPHPVISIEPRCAPADTSFPLRVRGSAWPPGAQIGVGFSRTEVEGPIIDEAGAFDVTLNVGGRPSGTYLVEGFWREDAGVPPDYTAQSFQIPCVTAPSPDPRNNPQPPPDDPPPPPPGTASPSLLCDPPIGPPGFVTTAVGLGFPPNTSVSLGWSVGITAVSSPVMTDASGGFRAPVLVVVRDAVGSRQLLADYGEPGADAAADFLVVPGPLAPGGLDREIVYP